MCFFRKHKEPEVVEKVVEKIVEVEKKYDEEFIQNFKEFSEYWKERRNNSSNKHGVTVKVSMIDKVDKILNGIKV